MDHLSSLELDALELRQEEPGAAAREHLASCPRCAGNLAELRASRAKFEGEVFARTLAAVERRGARRWRWFWRLSPALVAAAIGVSLVAQQDREFTAKGGSPACEVFAYRAGKVFTVKDGSAVTPGDEIRFVVRPAGHRHVLVASIDAA